MTIDAWKSQIKEAAARRHKLAIRGSGSKSFCTLRASSDTVEVLDTRAYAGIVEYEPNELVIVVRCGTRLSEVEALMADSGQMLAFEPPQFGNGATVGGTVAAGLSGPRRPYAGSVRDFVLGCKVLDGKGDHLAFGGKVMKNVAGFDVSRLMTGSMGSLGVVTEAAFKCLPLPKTQQTRVFDLDAVSAVIAMNRWYAEANPITAATWVNGKLHIRLAGAEPAVNSSAARLGGELLGDDVAWWRDWREQQHAFFAGEHALIRVACRSNAPWGDIANGPEQQAMEWGGALRWLKTSLDALPAIREWARAEGGHATVFRGAASDTDRAAPPQPALAGIQAKVKQSFDPYNIFMPL
jgi:glycolate oxidase FAD binding subunit